MNAVQSALVWLHAQAQTVLGLVSAIIANRPAPARQLLTYTFIVIGLAWAVPKLVKILKK